MKRQHWYKWVVRSIVALLMFVAVGVLISVLSPGPSPVQQGRFMMGMMDAMHRSMMGSMMGIAAQDGWTNWMILFLTSTFMVIIPVSAGVGLILRKWMIANEKE
jgi:hypothetical protein